MLYREIKQVDKKVFLLQVKINGDSYSSNIAESENDNQIARSPTKVNGKELNLKTTFVIKKYCMWF